MSLFTVTYTIVTPESAEHGDFDECDAVDTYDNLRDAIKALRQTRTCHVDGVECIDAEQYTVNVVNGMEYLTGAQESRTLHRPNDVTLSSWARIARLAGTTLRI